MKYPLRPLVFWPTFLILLAAVIFDRYKQKAKRAA